MITAESFPSPEDWSALQGGQPRIFESPTGVSFEIIHVYDPQLDPIRARDIPQYGCLVPTIGENLHNSLRAPLSISFVSQRPGGPRARNIMVPAALLFEHHGKACTDRTYDSGSRAGGYTRLERQAEYEAHLRALANKGFAERYLAIDAQTKGFCLQPFAAVA